MQSLDKFLTGLKLRSLVQKFDGASRGNPGPSGAGAVLMESATKKEACPELFRSSISVLLSTFLSNEEGGVGGVDSGPFFLTVIPKRGVVQLYYTVYPPISGEGRPRS
jgi:hypothetical protein